MTPEQEAKLKELIAVLGEGRDENIEQMKADHGPQAHEAWLEAMRESGEACTVEMQRGFLTQPADHPLLALAITQMVGAHVVHAMRDHPGMSDGERLRLLHDTVMGSLETIVHLSFEAVEGK